MSLVAGSLIPGPGTCGRGAAARISGRGPGRASSAEPGIRQMLGCATLGPPHLATETRAQANQMTQHGEVMFSGCRRRRGMLNEPNTLFWFSAC